MYEVLQAVGSTIRSLKNKIRECLNIIRSGSEVTPISRHFKEWYKGKIGLLTVQGIEQVTLGPKGGDLQSKLLAEVKWIYKLCTRQLQGLKSVFEMSCYF